MSFGIYLKSTVVKVIDRGYLTLSKFSVPHMQRVFPIIFFLTLALGWPSLHAQTVTEGRPKIGLVLSGGGAKGFAHIGAIKVLEIGRAHV